MVKKIRIGTGAGYSGDRIEPAVKLAESGNLDYLVFECLAERTIALAQHRKLKDPSKGYDPLLEERMRRVLPHCAQNKTKIITNMGAANVRTAGEKVVDLLGELGLTYMKVGIVTGDDILDQITANDFSQLKEPEKIFEMKDKVISANAYLGSSPIVEVLGLNADIVITGRTCDPSLFLAPMMHEFGWKDDNWDKIGSGIALAHLMECGAQVTGGYIADPGFKDVESLADLGFPICEVSESGEALITKLENTGGEVNLRTCKEQLLYEVHDPSSYFTSDGVSDFTKIKLEDLGKDTVKVTGGTGRKRPRKLKVSIGFRNGYVGEAQISYLGEGAKPRAELAARIIMERIKMLSLKFEKIRFDFLGGGHLPSGSPSFLSLNEVRLRVAGRAKTRETAQKLCNEVEALYTNGPAGGGGVTKRMEESIAITSSFIPREEVVSSVEILGSEND
jgi:hypothetical protein